MTGPRIGSLFTGAGGLDIAVQAVFGGQIIWQCENDPAATKVLRHHWPHTANLGDITRVHWNTVDLPDIIAGGFPCQDVSPAGRRAGLAGSRSGLWAHMVIAVEALQPDLVIIENVRGLLSASAHRAMEPTHPTMGNRPTRPLLRAAGAVLGTLAQLRYDAAWGTLAASDIGACHERERLFVVAYRAAARRWPTTRSIGIAAITARGAVPLLPTPSAADGTGGHMNRSGKRRHELLLPGIARTLLPTPRTTDTNGEGKHGDGGPDLRTAVTDAARWGRYGTAIRRWEILTRPAPPPTAPNRNNKPRLNPAFSEWMLGWPPGHVTDPAIGLTRNQQLAVIGNGVVPQQAEAAIRFLHGIASEACA